MSTIRHNEFRLEQMKKNIEETERNKKVSTIFKTHLPHCTIWPIIKKEADLKIEKVNIRLDNIKDLLYNNTNAPIILAGLIEAKEQLKFFSEFVDNIIKEGGNYDKALFFQEKEVRDYEKTLDR